jgi:hypothetical protein
MPESLPTPADINRRLEEMIISANRNAVNPAHLDALVADAAKIGDAVHPILSRLDDVYGFMSPNVTGALAIVRDRFFDLIPEAEGEDDVGGTLIDDAHTFGTGIQEDPPKLQGPSGLN